MGPDYTRPDVTPPESFRMQDVSSDMPSLANMPWWELLQDTELQKLIRISLEENKDLQQAAASVEEFQARLSIARTDFIPQLNATGNSPSFGSIGSNPSPNYAAQGNLSWELDIWGRIRRSNEASRAELFAREENQRAVVLQLVSGVAQAYFDLRQFDLQLDIARQSVENWERSVKIASARLRQGVISKLDLDQFEAERANAAARSAQFERSMIQKENELSVLLGRNPRAIPRGRSLTEQTMPPEVPTGLPSALLQRRPDILQAEQQLAAATARIGVAKADRFPKITLTGVLGVVSPQLANLLGSESGAVGLGLAAPLLNATSLGFEQQAVEAQAKQALAQYEQAILVAFKEVEDALVAVRTSQEQRAAVEDQVNALQSAWKLADKRYRNGLASFLEVLTAQRNLFEAELSLSQTHRLYLVSIVQLYKALGGGWSPEKTPEELRS